MVNGGGESPPDPTTGLLSIRRFGPFFQQNTHATILIHCPIFDLNREDYHLTDNPGRHAVSHGCLQALLFCGASAGIPAGMPFVFSLFVAFTLFFLSLIFPLDIAGYPVHQGQAFFPHRSQFDPNQYGKKTCPPKINQWQKISQWHLYAPTVPAGCL